MKNVKPFGPSYREQNAINIFYHGFARGAANGTPSTYVLRSKSACLFGVNVLRFHYLHERRNVPHFRQHLCCERLEQRCKGGCTSLGFNHLVLCIVPSESRLR